MLVIAAGLLAWVQADWPAAHPDMALTPIGALDAVLQRSQVGRIEIVSFAARDVYGWLTMMTSAAILRSPEGH